MGPAVNLESMVHKAPRGGLNPNRGFVEPGAFLTNRLRGLPEIEMFKGNSILDQMRAERKSAKPRRDRLRLAYYYRRQALYHMQNPGTGTAIDRKGLYVAGSPQCIGRPVAVDVTAPPLDHAATNTAECQDTIDDTHT